ncbi:hypothetical protein CJF32_00006064 [Rutstroemia sp. NJR-2017a WRK4]|nr:hypothetical protein CJF32_00006064 [Rutstroemia sp. NJR-2017a WRK4]
MDQSKKKKPGKVRIPDHLRRRALVSCDRCKKRRIRCSRSSNSDGQEACRNCLEAGVDCESTLPRKTRIYGSVETLSLRYRVLDALVKGLYPNSDTTNVDVLYEIAAAQGIAIPDLSGDYRVEEVFDKVPPALATSPLHSEGSPNGMEKMKEEPASTEKAPVTAEERLVPTPQGGQSHYIGPSSSFGFVLTCRKMVAEYNAALSAARPDDERVKLSSDFAGSRWSKALEPKIAEEKHTAPGPADLEQNNNRMQVRSHVISVVPSKDQSGKSPLSLLLPNKEVADVLIESFFDRVHPNFMLFHRTSFLQRYEIMWSQRNLLQQDFEAGWLCCVLMALVLGAQALEQHEDAYVEPQRRHVEWVESRVYQLLSSSSLVNIQALLLLQLHQHNFSERNTAFMLLGAASRMAMNLGMHREGATETLDPIEREVRRRVWWTIYLFEQNQCTILGRPCAIDDTEISVRFPDENVLDGGTCVPLGYVEHMVRLMKLMSEIRRKMYPSSTSHHTEQPRIRVAMQLLLDLDSWHHSLPPNLRLEFQSLSPVHGRAVLLLHLQFHLTQALVTRPFILRKVAVQLARRLGKHVRSQDLDEEELKLSSSCGLYSKQAVLIVHQLILSGQFNGVTWMDPYYIYHSVFVLALDFLGRPTDESDTPEDLSRKKVVLDIIAAMNNIRLCPLFVILTQVAFQLVKIVGILDPVPNTQPQPHPHSSLSPKSSLPPTSQHLTPQPLVPIDFGLEASQAGMSNIADFWTQGSGLSWKLPPDANGFPHVSAPMIGTFVNRGPGMGVVDEVLVGGHLQPFGMAWETGGFDVGYGQQHGGGVGGFGV